MKIQYILLIISIAGMLLCSVFMRNQVKPILKNDQCAISDSLCFSGSLILALEFACNSRAVNHVFAKCKADKVTAIRNHTRIDFGYIISYVLFFIVAGRLLFRKNRTWYQTVFVLSLVTGLCDVLENIHIFQLLNDLGNTGSINQTAGTMEFFVWIKWLAAILVAAILLVRLLRVAWNKGIAA